ncbi:hypothetical protein [Sporisorium scitamineum]|uniref:Uncharacterized protein n=1 Tax=Sporisorium scitamineum TaxID=49012 RepID=A0A0F7S199_9BASI|nr:hypothetical protein [Sporisorium scitamineum]
MYLLTSPLRRIHRPTDIGFRFRSFTPSSASITLILPPPAF